MNQQEGDEEPAYPPVAIEEWMDRLKLGVGNARVHQGWHIAAFVHEVLEIAKEGVPRHKRRAGMGLRLAALEAIYSGGVLEFGEREAGTWLVRLVVPDHV